MENVDSLICFRVSLTLLFSVTAIQHIRQESPWLEMHNVRAGILFLDHKKVRSEVLNFNFFWAHELKHHSVDIMIRNVKLALS
jgi:hypothetical protein